MGRWFNTLLLVLLSAQLGQAADWQGQVTTLRASNTSDVVLFALDGKLKSAASCNEFQMYAVDLRLPGGSALYQLLTDAFIHDLAVEANSLGTCKSYWKAEGVKEIFLRK